jgi:hypothetical protein
VAVHRTDWATTRYRLSACNDGGCTPSADIGIANAMLNAIVYAKASNTGAQDRFGWAVSLSSDGQTLAVGAPDESSNATGIDGNQANEAAPSSGAVYVFVRSSTTWSQQAYIKASNAGANDAFGTAVSLSADGNWLAIGASNEASSASGVNGDQADNTAPGSGAVYVFYRQGSTWGQQAYLKASNTDSNDRFGETLSLSAQGNTLAIGARGESSGAAGVNGDQADNTSAFSGAAYVFVRDGAAWTQQAYIKPSNTGLNDQFGWQVSLSGDGATLAVGAWGEDSSATGIDGDQADNTSGQSGAVYVFVRQGSMWTQQAYIKASNAASNDQFGIAVSLSTDGNTLAVSADGEDSSAVGVGGDQTDNLGSASGAVYVFARQGSTWSQQAYIKASNAETSDRFSSQVSLSADGNTLAAGAVREGSVAVGINGTQVDNTAPFSGAVYLFARQGSTWSQRSFIKASNTNAGDTFGRGIDLSDDGSTLAVGAYSESSGASGINGDQADNSAPRSGAVYLY